MINQKDWKTFTEMLELESKIGGEKMLDDIKKHTKEMQRDQEKEVARAMARGGLVRSCYRPFIGIVPQSYSKTVEGCLDWVVAGRPVFAKKLTVKSV